LETRFLYLGRLDDALELLLYLAILVAESTLRLFDLPSHFLEFTTSLWLGRNGNLGRDLSWDLESRRELEVI